MALQLRIDGPDADGVAGTLIESGRWEAGTAPVPPGERDKDFGASLAVIATVIGAVGGIVSIVDTLLTWRDRGKSTPANTIVLYVGDRSLPLTGSSRQELVELLETDPELVGPA